MELENIACFTCSGTPSSCRMKPMACVKSIDLNISPIRFASITEYGLNLRAKIDAFQARMQDSVLDVGKVYGHFLVGVA